MVHHFYSGVFLEYLQVGLFEHLQVWLFGILEFWTFASLASWELVIEGEQRYMAIRDKRRKCRLFMKIPPSENDFAQFPK